MSPEVLFKKPGERGRAREHREQVGKGHHAQGSVRKML